ncbi:MAG: hypothetical protein IT178_16500 [Acidobacteria bacterium]|nr:hypothetical protein [Acidobacteriota bacterium]
MTKRYRIESKAGQVYGVYAGETAKDWIVVEVARDLYIVSGGEAARATADEIRAIEDGAEAVGVLAADETEALELARRYDAGEIEVGNRAVGGETVGVLCGA